MLMIFSGLPGSGKSTLASGLARRRGAVYLRIDTIEQAIRNSGLSVDGPAGYMVGYEVARDNLRLGRIVVVDSVNPIEITRRAWREVATQSDAPFVEIEVICSDREEHRRRVESRVADVAGLRLPTWSEVVEREYEDWHRERLVIDTAGQTPEESLLHLLELLRIP